MCASPDVDAVLVCNASPFHVPHAILALRNDKNVFVEKPLASCYRDIEALEAAEAQSRGRLFVGYMRRYAPALAAVIAEVGDRDIQYGRVRDIIGPNDDFVAQSATFPKRFSDYTNEDSMLLSTMSSDVHNQALKEEFGVPVTKLSTEMLDILGSLGTHDLSAMRDIFGMPRRVIGADLRSATFWSAIFDYGRFSVVYESGMNSVPVFDAHIEVYTDEKMVRVEYDTPYIKGLPTKMVVRERLQGPDNASSYQERHVRLTYEDTYTVEFRKWHDAIIHGASFKTTIQDARYDVDLFKLLMQFAYR